MRKTALLSVLCTALAVASAPAALAGDLVAYEGTDMIRLSHAECTNQAVLQRIEPDARAAFRTASAMLQGQRYTACWSVTATAVYLVYEDGDQGLVPVSKLKVPVDV